MEECAAFLLRCRDAHIGQSRYASGKVLDYELMSAVLRIKPTNMSEFFMLVCRPSFCTALIRTMKPNTLKQTKEVGVDMPGNR